MEGRYPYGQVSLLLGADNHQCGGTVVAPDMILTAGHCLGYFDTIRVGDYDRTDPDTFVQTFESIQKIRHPRFEPVDFRYDVMLVKVDGLIEKVTPVMINSNDQLPFYRSELTIVGWGKTNRAGAGDERTFPYIIQQATVPYVPNQRCASAEYDGNQLYKDDIYDEMMCAGQTGVDACNGDSGSPLILPDAIDGMDIQVGLVSWGRGCAKYPGVYSRMSKVFPWIRWNVCWNSAEPPAYLQCQPSERNPSLQTPTPVLATLLSRAPSLSPLQLSNPTQASEDEENGSDRNSNALQEDAFSALGRDPLDGEPASGGRRDLSSWICIIISAVGGMLLI